MWCEQAVCCQLRGMPPDDTQWSFRAADWLMDSAIGCRIKVVNDTPLTVDILKQNADGFTSLVDEMAARTDLWDR